MPTNVKIIQAREFIRARPDGHACLDRAEPLLAETLLKFRGTFAKRTAVVCPIEKFDHTRVFTFARRTTDSTSSPSLPTRTPWSG